MLTIHVRENELWDPIKNEFIQVPEQTIRLEHSLLAISKWEAHWKTPYLRRDKKTREQSEYYIYCMCVDEPTSYDVIHAFSRSDYKQIKAYIEDKRTATSIKKTGSRNSGEDVTSELIYYWMLECGIPFECESWNLNRLLTLIQVCGEKRSPQKKVPTSEIYARNRALNAARRKAYHSKG